MLEDFGPKELEKLAQTLRKLHGRLNWADPEFSLDKSVFMATLAQVAYGAVGADERQRRARAGLVPSDAFQSLVRRPPFDFADIVSGGEFERVIIVRTPSFVALLFISLPDIFIGVRGTVFAYDWGINLDARRYYQSDDAFDGFLHWGFHREGLILSHLIAQKLNAMNINSDTRIHVAGHSLGGAVAGILAVRRFISLPGYGRIWHPTNTYTYAAPRIGSFRAVCDAVVYATRREHDVVPHTPPKWLGYADFLLEFDTRGEPYVARDGLFARSRNWLRHSLGFPIVRDHKIETYIREIESAANPRNAD